MQFYDKPSSSHKVRNFYLNLISTSTHFQPSVLFPHSFLRSLLLFFLLLSSTSCTHHTISTISRFSTDKMNLLAAPSGPPDFFQPDPDDGNHFSGDRGDQTLDKIMFVTFFLFLGVAALMVILRVAVYLVRNRQRLSEDELMREEENQAYLELGSEEQELYFQSKEYLLTNPYLRGELALSQNLAIQERGIKAWEFIKDPMLTNNDVIVVNKTELNFLKDFECSVLTNLPMPQKNDVYYFECKMYHLPEDGITVSVGLGIKPYPWFRLPGRHSYTVSYDSDGHRRHAQPFPFTGTAPPFPQFAEGDVIGVGYRVRSGTVFFTRNGKKVSELKIGGHIRNFKIPDKGHLYPIIGANNMCSVHVNLGQMGFVFIEGNVKKWGFAPLEGNGPAPPAYNKFNADILLERSEIDESDISDRESDFPPDFWEVNDNDQDKYSYNAYGEVNSTDERITLDSIRNEHEDNETEEVDPPSPPPSYSDGNEVEANSPREEPETGAEATQEIAESTEAGETTEAREEDETTEHETEATEDHTEAENQSEVTAEHSEGTETPDTHTSPPPNH